MVHSVGRRALWRAVAVLSAVLVGAGTTVAALGAPASAATTLPITTATVVTVAHVAGPLGIAASGGDLYVTHPYGEAATEYVTVISGAGTVHTQFPLTKFTARAYCTEHPSLDCTFSSWTVEPYVAVAPGTATSAFAGGEVYITQGPNVYVMPAGGGKITLFTTIPEMLTGVYKTQCCNIPEYASGITFDTVGTYTHDMILTSPNGTAWKVTAAGTATLLGTVGTHTAAGRNPTTVIEGPAVAPASFTPYGGDLLVAAERQGKVLALEPTTGSPTGYVFVPIATVTQAEGIEVIPASACAVTMGGAPFAWFTTLWHTNQASNRIGALPASVFSNRGGDVLVQSEHAGSSAPTAPGVTLLSPKATAVASSVFVNALPQQEGATFEQCPGGTTGAKTIGYWRNKIGNAELSSATPSLWPVGLGTPTDTGPGFGITVTGNTGLTQSNAFLDGTACGQKHGILAATAFFTCTTPGLATGLHERTFEDLVAQTLALSYNVEASATLAGTVFSGCNATYITGTVLTGLTPPLGASSSVTAILTAANLLIATSISGGTTTQTEAGAMTALLGECINTV